MPAPPSLDPPDTNIINDLNVEQNTNFYIYHVLGVNETEIYR